MPATGRPTRACFGYRVVKREVWPLSRTRSHPLATLYPDGNLLQRLSTGKIDPRRGGELLVGDIERESADHTVGEVVAQSTGKLVVAKEEFTPHPPVRRTKAVPNVPPRIIS